MQFMQFLSLLQPQRPVEPSVRPSPGLFAPELASSLHLHFSSASRQSIEKYLPISAPIVPLSLVPGALIHSSDYGPK
jgi:hypothetical protein